MSDSNQIWASPGKGYASRGLGNYIVYGAFQSATVPTATPTQLAIVAPDFNNFPNLSDIGLEVDLTGTFTCKEDMVLQINACIKTAGIALANMGTYREYGVNSPAIASFANAKATEIQPPSDSIDNAATFSFVRRFAAGDTINFVFSHDAAVGVEVRANISQYSIIRLC